MLLICSPIPSIYITPAPPDEIHPEPFSPIPSAKPDVEDDGYRAKQLSLPPLASTPPWYSSPLRPADCPPHTGLSRDQFYSLPNVSREQRANLGTQKIPDLRKELALKSQRLKERTVERRARFLSKVKEPPRIATISIPKVSLESPTTAHCSILPRGSESEFSALEVVAENPEHLVIVNSTTNPEWDEQVERGLLITKHSLTSSKFPRAVPKKSRHIPPSLDEITARLKPVHVSSTMDYSQSRLPNFLKASGLSPGSTGDQLKTVPVRSLALNDEKFDTTVQQFIQHPDPYTLGSKRAVIPRAVYVVAGPTLHTSRADTARDMIETLKRRSSPPPSLGHYECTRTIVDVKRRSAPAGLQYSERVGFNCVAV